MGRLPSGILKECPQRKLGDLQAGGSAGGYPRACARGFREAFMNREWGRVRVGAACPLASALGFLGEYGMASLHEAPGGNRGSASGVPGLAAGVFVSRPRRAAEAVTNRRRFAVRQMPADVLRSRNPWPRRRCRAEPANRAEIRGKKLF